MKVAGLDLSSASDFATAALSIPAAYFAWLYYGDPTLVSPSVVAGMAAPASVGVKRLIESTPTVQRLSQTVARREVARTQRFASGLEKEAAKLQGLRHTVIRANLHTLVDWHLDPDPLEEADQLIRRSGVSPVMKENLLSALTAFAATRSELVGPLASNGAWDQTMLEEAFRRDLDSLFETEIRRIGTNVATLDRLQQVAPMMTSGEIHTALVAIKQAMIDTQTGEIRYSDIFEMLPRTQKTALELRMRRTSLALDAGRENHQSSGDGPSTVEG